jgi:cGMP-dependent 3',5'-cyclic phosphodiesterase
VSQKSRSDSTSTVPSHRSPTASFDETVLLPTLIELNRAPTQRRLSITKEFVENTPDAADTSGGDTVNLSPVNNATGSDEAFWFDPSLSYDKRGGMDKVTKRESLAAKVLKFGSDSTWNNQHIALLKAAVSISMLSEYFNVLKRFIQGTSEIFSCEKVMLYIVDNDSKSLCEVYLHETSVGRKRRKIDDAGLVAECALKGKPIRETNVLSNKLYDVKTDGFHGQHPEALMLIPCFHAIPDTVFAVIKVVRQEPFNEDDEGLGCLYGSILFENIIRSEQYQALSITNAQTSAALAISKAFYSEIEISAILYKIKGVAKGLLKADRVDVFLSDYTNNSEFLKDLTNHDLIGFRRDSIVKSVEMGGEVINLCAGKDDQLLDIENNNDPEGYIHKQLLCMPISDSASNSNIAVIKVCNKEGNTAFKKSDLIVLRYICEYAGIALMQGRLLDSANKEKKKNKAMCQVIKCVSAGKGATVDSFLYSLADVIYNILEVDRINLYMFDEISNDLVCRVSKLEILTDTRVQLGVGIVGTVAQTKRIISIEKAYEDERFDPDVDEIPDYRSRNILCAPIMDESGHLVGVVHTVNKLKRQAFTDDDVDLMQAISFEAAAVLRIKSLEMSMDDVIGYAKLKRQTSGNIENLSSLLSQFKSSEVKVQSPGRRKTVRMGAELKELGLSNSRQYLEFDYNILDAAPADLEGISILLIDYFGLVGALDLDKVALSAFCREIIGSYRLIPYHNAYHGVGVMQFVFASIANVYKDYFATIDVLACLIASLCHDVNHPGKSNLFESNSKSRLALLYNDYSVLEMHHCAFASKLLYNPTYNFLRAVSPEDDVRFRKLFVDSILATDMSHHFELIQELKSLNHPLSKNSDKDRKLIACTMIHASDLSNPVLPNFEVVKRWAMMVCEEFTLQTKDEERLGITPTPHMLNLTTEKAISKLQVGFIDYVVAPLWTTLADIFPKFKVCVNNMKRNRDIWHNYAADREEDKVRIQSPVEDEVENSLNATNTFNEADENATENEVTSV